MIKYLFNVYSVIQFNLYIVYRYLKKMNHSDASIETVFSAQTELFQSYSTCNVETCLCPYPKQRKFQQEM